jgi:spore coat protein H
MQPPVADTLAARLKWLRSQASLTHSSPSSCQRWLGAVLALLVSGAAASAGAARRDAEQDRAQVDEVFSNAPVFRLALDIPKPGLDSLRKSPRKYVAATLREGEKAYQNVAIHLKGSIGSFRSVDDKPGLTLNFGMFNATDYFHGFRKFHLNNSVQDPSYLSEWICSELFRAAGVPGTRVAFALVEINGKKCGLYVLKESFDKEMLSLYFKDPHGNLYGQPGNGDISDRIERNEGKGPLDWADLRALAAAAKEPDASRRWLRLQERLDVERFISFMALEVMLNHWDGYTFSRHNYRVYHDLDTDRMVFFPHDLDQVIREPNGPIVPGANGLVAQAILKIPEGRRRYVERVGEIHTNWFQAPVLTNRIAQMVAQLTPTLQAYDPNLAREVASHAQSLARRFLARGRSLNRQLRPAPAPAIVGADGSPSRPAAAQTFPPTGPLRPGEDQWEPVQAQSASTLQRLELDNMRVLYIKSDQPNSVGAWRAEVVLSAGKYRFSGRVKVRGVAGQTMRYGTAGGLRISGCRRKNIFQDDKDWTYVEEEFDIPADGPVRLLCELRANKGEIWFDLRSLKLERLK